MEKAVGILRVQDQSGQAAQDIRAVGKRDFRREPNCPVAPIQPRLCLQARIAAYCGIPVGHFPRQRGALLLIPKLVAAYFIPVGVFASRRGTHKNLQRVGIRELGLDGLKTPHHGGNIIYAGHFIHHLFSSPVAWIVECGVFGPDIQMPAVNLPLGTILCVTIISNAVLRILLRPGH